MSPPSPCPRILVIAGSDSGGGAGIQADIKTVTMLGGHAMTAITALTAQNTLGVQAILPVPTEMVMAQIRSCVDDIGVDAVKIGMIGSAETANAIAEWLADIHAPVVLDPVMVASSGDLLVEAETIAAIHNVRTWAFVTTPNLPELQALGGLQALLDDGETVLVKGGHGDGDEVVDRLLKHDEEIAQWSAPRINTRSDHGTGCTLSSAIATFLARRCHLPEAITRARRFVRIALHEAPGLGSGHGPMGQQYVRQDVGFGIASPNHVTLPMTDYAVSSAFYETLGLTRIVEAAPRYARFESVGGVTLSIEAADEIDGRPIIFLECDNLDDTMDRLRSAGTSVEDGLEQQWGWREVRLSDPAGNALCLYQAGEMRRFPPWRLPDA